MVPWVPSLSSTIELIFREYLLNGKVFVPPQSGSGYEAQWQALEHLESSSVSDTACGSTIGPSAPKKQSESAFQVCLLVVCEPRQNGCGSVPLLLSVDPGEM